MAIGFYMVDQNRGVFDSSESSSDSWSSDSSGAESECSTSRSSTVPNKVFMMVVCLLKSFSIAVLRLWVSFRDLLREMLALAADVALSVVS